MLHFTDIEWFLIDVNEQINQSFCLTITKKKMELKSGLKMLTFSSVNEIKF